MFTLQFGDYTFPNTTFEVQSYPIMGDVKANSVPRRHGAIIQGNYIKERKFKVKGYLHNAAESSTHTELLALQAALTDGEQSFKDRADRYINARLSKFNPTNEKGTDKAVKEINLELIADDPFFYSIAGTTVNFSATAGTTQFDASNSGNVFAEPVFSFYASAGDISDGIKLTNKSKSNEVFQFRGTVADGTTLEVDSSDFTVENNGVDGLSYYEGDFMGLVAGSNTLEFEGSECEIEITFRPRFTG